MAVFGTTGKVLKEKLMQYVSENQIIDLLYDEEREKVFQSDSKVHIDFACRDLPNVERLPCTMLWHKIQKYFCRKERKRGFCVTISMKIRMKALKAL